MSRRVRGARRGWLDALSHGEPDRPGSRRVGEAADPRSLGPRHGRILTMLADTMMPEAFEHGGKLVGVFTTLGFALAFAISALE